MQRKLETAKAAVKAGSVAERQTPLRSLAGKDLKTPKHLAHLSLGSRGIPSLTGIRGVAALWVLSFHLQQSAGKYFDLYFLEKISIIKAGWHGVDIFFMLSGLILMYAHERDFLVISAARLLRFAKQRISRIYPLTTTVLLLILLFISSQPQFVVWMRNNHNAADYSCGAFFRTLFLATRWLLPGGGDWNQPVWSLSLEIIGYLLFPVLALYCARLKNIWTTITVAGICIAGADAILALHHSLFFNDIGPIAGVRMISYFVTGIAICRAHRITGELRTEITQAITVTAVLGIVGTCVVPHGETALNLFFALLLFGLTSQRGVVNALLASRLATYVGRISFPLYLVHMVPLLWLRYLFTTEPNRWSIGEKHLLLVTWLAFSFLAATLLHHFVEKPAHAIGRRWAANP